MTDITIQKDAATRLLANYNQSSIQLAVRELKITDDQSCQTATDLRNKCLLAAKTVVEYWDPLASQANKTHKMITSARKEMAEPWEKMALAANAKIEIYLRDLKAVEEKQRSDTEREAERQREQLRQESESLIAQGFVKQAREAEQKAAVIIPAPLPASIPKLTGNRVTEGWETKCVDVIALCRAIGAGEIPLMHDVKGVMKPIVEVNQTVLNAITSRQLGKTKLPGCKTEETLSAGATRL